MSMKPNNQYRGNQKEGPACHNRRPQKHPHAEPRKPKDPAMESINEILNDLEKKMDADFMETGKDLAVLFRAVCTAAAKLPDMELHTELMSVTNNDEGLTVVFSRENAEKGNRIRNDYKEFFKGFEDDDEEEGMLYDGD